MSTQAVLAAKLTKRYGDFLAVDGIDFAIAPGTCFGFLGPNGAGKTTTMRMITGRSPITSGRLEVLGLDARVAMRQIKARIGIVSQDDNLDEDFTARDNLIVYAGYYEVPHAEAARRADELLAFAGLEDKARTRVDQLSGGQQRRLCIVRALVNRPELVVLDEPTTGLDPQARHIVWGRLRELRRSGVTLLLTTHYMDEAAQLCDRLVVMDHGHILIEGQPDDLVRENAGGAVLEVEPELPPREAALLPAVRAVAQQTEAAGDTLLVYTQDIRAATALAVQVPHRSYRVRPATLEDVFLRLTGRSMDAVATDGEGHA
jgi:lipooligosaccharide transport system ATP-binding protein